MGTGLESAFLGSPPFLPLLASWIKSHLSAFASPASLTGNPEMLFNSYLLSRLLVFPEVFSAARSRVTPS